MSDEMVKWKLNGREVQNLSGTSLLEACRSHGVQLPALCNGGENGHSPSCMVCFVEVEKDHSLISSCGRKVEKGLSIITESENISFALSSSSRLLLNEHGGDCYSPCSLACKGGLDSSYMSTFILNGQYDKAARYAFRKLGFPQLLSKLCYSSCTKACRRGQVDQSVDIPFLHSREVMDYFQISPMRRTGKTALIFGNSPECWSAGHFLNLQGVKVLIVYKKEKIFPLEQNVHLSDLKSDIQRLELSGIEFVEQNRFSTIHHENFDYILRGSITGDSKESNIKIIEENPDNTNLLQRIINGRTVISSVKVRKSVSRIHSYSDREKSLFLDFYRAPANPSDVKEQAASCLLCRCSSVDNCSLKKLAEATGQRQKAGHFLRSLEPPLIWGELVYEFAKCINCGLCIKISNENENIPTLGMAFKGLDSRVIHLDKVRFQKKEALLIVRSCPTGALRMRRKFEG